MILKNCGWICQVRNPLIKSLHHRFVVSNLLVCLLYTNRPTYDGANFFKIKSLGSTSSNTWHINIARSKVYVLYLDSSGIKKFFCLSQYPLILIDIELLLIRKFCPKFRALCFLYEIPNCYIFACIRIDNAINKTINNAKGVF